MSNRRMLGVFCVAMLTVAGTAPGRGGDHDHDDHHQHHGPVVEARDLDHAVTLVRDGLESLGAAVARGDLHALHELSDGVAAPARLFGKLAASRPGAAPANLRGINTLGLDIAKLVDAMHVAADAGKPEVVVAKWEQLKPLMAQLDAVSPRLSLVVGIDSPPTAGGKAMLALSIRDGDGSMVSSFEGRGGSGLRVFVVSPGVGGVEAFLAEVDGRGSARLDVSVPVAGGYTVFCVAQPAGRGAPMTFRAGFEVGGAGDRSAAGLVADAESSKRVGAYLVRMDWPDHAHPGETVTIGYRIDGLSGPGGVVAEEIEGEAARFVGVSADALDLVLASGVERGDAGELRVKAVFPRAGLYQTWFEFRHGGADTRVGFVVEVHDDH